MPPALRPPTLTGLNALGFHADSLPHKTAKHLNCSLLPQIALTLCCAYGLGANFETKSVGA